MPEIRLRQLEFRYSSISSIVLLKTKKDYKNLKKPFPWFINFVIKSLCLVLLKLLNQHLLDLATRPLQFAL